MMIAVGPLLLAVSLSAPAAGPQVLPWIEDDYPKALAAARAKKVPIFVDNWAPW